MCNVCSRCSAAVSETSSSRHSQQARSRQTQGIPHCYGIRVSRYEGIKLSRYRGIRVSNLSRCQSIKQEQAAVSSSLVPAPLLPVLQALCLSMSESFSQDRASFNLRQSPWYSSQNNIREAIRNIFPLGRLLNFCRGICPPACQLWLLYAREGPRIRFVPSNVWAFPPLFAASFCCDYSFLPLWSLAAAATRFSGTKTMPLAMRGVFSGVH